MQLTSQPISRNAYGETRRWLLAQHGPVCAYCGKRYDEDLITLDHVRPHRHGAAQNRRDNLVLACTFCNGRKADKELLVFIFQDRRRAIPFVRYGQHLSPLLLEEPTKIAANLGFSIADADSPYLDVNWVEPVGEISEAEARELLEAAEAHYAQQDAEDAAEEEAEREAVTEAVKAAVDYDGEEEEEDSPYAD